MADLILCKANETTLQGVPETVKLLPLGSVKSVSGNFEVDQESFADIKSMFQNRGVDIVIDYEHQTLKDVQAPAAGWIKDLFLEDDAIVAKVEWTPPARKYLENKEYKYLSPVLQIRKRDHKAIVLHSAALTNTPAINEMYPIINSLSFKLDEGGSTNNMDIIKKIAALLGLDESTPEEEVLQKLTDALKDAKQLQANAEAADKVVANKTICGLLGLQPGAKTEDAAAAIQVLKAPVSGTVSKAEFDALQLRLAKKDADEVVTMALKAGKLAAAQKDWALEYALKDPSGFAGFVEKAPQGVPVGELEYEIKANKAVGAPDEIELKVYKMLGVSSEEVEKYGKDGK